MPSYGWGTYNAYGEVGVGDTLPHGDGPVPMNTSVDFVQMAVSYLHCAGVTADKQLYTWGYGGDYGLGLGDLNHRYSPTLVTDTNVAGKVVEVTCGQLMTAVRLDDGTAWAVGFNSSGRFGMGAPVTTSYPVWTRLTNAPANPTQLSAGTSNLGILAGGALFFSGESTRGEAGDGTTTDKLTMANYCGLAGIAKVSLNDQFIIAVMNDGSVRSWGRNAEGQLGIGNIVTPKTTPQTMLVVSSVVDAATQQSDTLVMSPTTVWGCGNNFYGNLGQGDTVRRSTPVVISIGGKTPAKVFGGDDGQISWVITTDGELWGCGSNNSKGLASPAPPWSYTTMARRWEAILGQWAEVRVMEEGESIGRTEVTARPVYAQIIG